MTHVYCMFFQFQVFTSLNLVQSTYYKYNLNLNNMYSIVLYLNNNIAGHIRNNKMMIYAHKYIIQFPTATATIYYTYAYKKIELQIRNQS